MDPYLVLVLIMVLFAGLVGGLSLLRRERLAWRCAAEALFWGVLLLAAAWALQVTSPVIYLAALYLVSMRSRVLIDAANMLAARRRPSALRLYALARRLATNPVDRAAVEVNRGAALLYAGRNAEAAGVLEEALAGPGLGSALASACRCNLGLAYMRQGDAGRARRELSEAIELMPGSGSAARARLALRRLDAPPADA